MILTKQTLYKLINESLRDDQREKLITLLSSSVENATFAFELMDRLELDEMEQMDMINDAISRIPKITQDSVSFRERNELYSTLKRKINEILMRDFEGFDLGDFNER